MTKRFKGGEAAPRTPGKPNPTAEAASECDLVSLLQAPVTQSLMEADGITPEELSRLLDGVIDQRRRQGLKARIEESDVDMKQFRQGVGILLLNSGGDVFIGRRADVGHEAWQLPQGGIEPGETPAQAALRELKEETGIDQVDIVAESRDWFLYLVPPRLARKAWGKRWKGQRQKWFVMRFKGDDSIINLQSSYKEFDAWRWIKLSELLAVAPTFKRQLYEEVLGEFSMVFRD